MLIVDLRILGQLSGAGHVKDLESFQQLVLSISSVQLVLEQFDESWKVKWTLGFSNHSLKIGFLGGLTELLKAGLQFFVVNGTITILVDDSKSLCY